MKKTILIFVGCVLVCAIAFAQQYKGQISLTSVPVPKHHYQEEYTFDSTIDLAMWSSQAPGLQVSFGSTDKLYRRTEVPNLEKQNAAWEETGWKGERLNAQLLVWSLDTVRQVRFKWNDGRNIRKDYRIVQRKRRLDAYRGLR